MKKFLILLILFIPLIALSKWNKFEGPKYLKSLQKLAGNKDLLVCVTDGIHFSIDEGKTWEKRENGLPKNWEWKDGSFAIENGVVYVSLIFDKKDIDTYKTGIFYTLDMGLHWREIEFDERFKKNDLAKNTRRNTIFKVSDSTLFLFPYKSINYINEIDSTGEQNETEITSIIYSTANFGKSWNETTIKVKDIKSFRFNFLDMRNDTIVVGESNAQEIGGEQKCPSGFAISIDTGKNWEVRNNGLDTCNIKCVKLDGKRVFVGETNGLYYSEDLGETWNEAKSMRGKEVTEIAIMNDDIVAATSMGLFSSSDDLNNWESVEIFNNKRIRDIFWNGEYLYIYSSELNYTNEVEYRTKDLINFERVGLETEIDYTELSLNNSNMYFGSKGLSNNFIYSIEDLTKSSFIILKDSIPYYLNNVTSFNNILIFSILNTSPFDPSKFLISKNAGQTFELIQNDEIKSSVVDLQLLNEDSILAFTYNAGIYLSSNCGSTFEQFYLKDTILNKKLQQAQNIKKIGDEIFIYNTNGFFETNIYLDKWKLNNNFKGIVRDISVSGDKYFIVINDGNHNYTLKSFDKGETWDSLQIDLDNLSNIVPTKIFNFRKNIFVASDSSIIYSKDNGSTWLKINEGIIDYKSNGKFAVFKENIIYSLSNGIYYQKLEDLGIEYTSVEKTAETSSGDCYILKEVEYYDVIGNKLNKEDIYNKRIIVKYKCLETGNFQYKLEYRVR